MLSIYTSEHNLFLELQDFETFMSLHRKSLCSQLMHDVVPLFCSSHIEGSLSHSQPSQLGSTIFPFLVMTTRL